MWKTSVELGDYQREYLEKIDESFESEKRKILVPISTGDRGNSLNLSASCPQLFANCSQR